MRPKYSIIIPLFNRPGEVDELLNSLCYQAFTDFEVIIVEDGSEIKAEEICSKYAETLRLHYFYKENEGPGKARNYGCEKATSDFFIFFDSDCIIPKDYLYNLTIAFQNKDFDAFGGPDAADESFTPIQKAINYSMTSLFTTGGIRGSKQSVEKFNPRSFNMGISRKVYEKTGGFSPMRFGEDIDFSLRIAEARFRAVLLPECFVYHKRRTDFRKFFRQVFNSGIARINLYKRHPKSLKVAHFFPAVFTLYLLFAVLIGAVLQNIAPLIPLILYLAIIFIDSGFKNKNLTIAFLSTLASLIQLSGYGLGFLKGLWRRIILRKPEFHAFEKNFYK